MLKKIASVLIVLVFLSHGVAVNIGAQQISAQLITSANAKIRVNGAEAATGDSVFSGSLLELPGNVNAILIVGNWGKVELLPGSSAELVFQNNDIRLLMREGCAILTTNRGTTGRVLNNDGNLLRANAQAVEGDMQDNTLRQIPNTLAQSDGKLQRVLPVCDILNGVVADKAAAGFPRGILIAGGGGLGAVAVGLIISGTTGGVELPVEIIPRRGENPTPSGL